MPFGFPARRRMATLVEGLADDDNLCSLNLSHGSQWRHQRSRDTAEDSSLIVLEDADRLLERNRERSSCVLCDVRQRLLRPYRGWKQWLEDRTRVRVWSRGVSSNVAVSIDRVRCQRVHAVNPIGRKLAVPRPPAGR